MQQPHDTRPLAAHLRFLAGVATTMKGQKWIVESHLFLPSFTRLCTVCLHCANSDYTFGADVIELLALLCSRNPAANKPVAQLLSRLMA